VTAAATPAAAAAADRVEEAAVIPNSDDSSAGCSKVAAESAHSFTAQVLAEYVLKVRVGAGV
jgi:hypothetical protein